MLFLSLQSNESLKIMLLTHLDFHNKSTKSLFGLPINNMLLRCVFNNNRCTYKDFFHIFHFEYGNCFFFESNINITSPGTSQALELDIFGGFEKDMIEFYTNYGLKIMIYDKKENPQYFNSIRLISVKPNTEISIGLRK